MIKNLMELLGRVRVLHCQAYARSPKTLRGHSDD